MKITRIALQNFRSHELLDITLEEPTVVIVGPNAAGKSSVVDAATFALLGYCRGTDKAGRGAAALIRDGQDVGGASVDVNGLRVTRSINQKSVTVYFDRDAVGAALVKGALEEKVGAPAAAIYACLNYEGFFSLDHVGQKALLLGALGVTGKLREIENKYTDAKDRRTAAKATIKTLGTAPAGNGDPPPPVDKIRGQLEKLRDKLEEAVRVRGETIGRREILQADIQKLELEGKGPSKASYTKAVKDYDTAVKHLAEWKESADATAAAITRAKNKVQGLEAEVEGCKEALQQLEQAAGESMCTSWPKIKCPLKPKDKDKMRDAFSGALSEACKLLDKASKDVVALEKGRKLTAPDKYEKARDVAAEKIRLYEAAQKGAAALKAALKALEDIPDMPGLDGEIATLKTRIDKGQEILDNALLTAGDQDKVQKLEEARQALKDAEEDCKTYGPKGERLELIRDSVGPFLKMAGDVVRIFGFQGVGIVTDPWSVTVGERPAEILSTSERMVLSLAVQVALAKHTGVNVVALDGAEILAGPFRKALSSIAVAGLVDRIIILSTVDEAFKPVPVPGKLQFVEIGR